MASHEAFDMTETGLCLFRPFNPKVISQSRTSLPRVTLSTED